MQVAADISTAKANLNKPVTTDAIAKFDLNADGSITQAGENFSKPPTVRPEPVEGLGGLS